MFQCVSERLAGESYPLGSRNESSMLLRLCAQKIRMVKSGY